MGDIYLNTTTNHSRVCTFKAAGMAPDVWTVVSGEINAETYGAKCDGTNDDTAALGISGIEALNGRLGRVTFNFTTPVNTLFLQYGGSGYTPNLTNYSWPVSAAGCSPVTTVGLTTNSVGTITGGTISPGSNCTSVPIIDMDANCSSHNCQGSILVQLRATLDIDTSNSTAFPNPYALPRAQPVSSGNATL